MIYLFIFIYALCFSHHISHQKECGSGGVPGFDHGIERLGSQAFKKHRPWDYPGRLTAGSPENTGTPGSEETHHFQVRFVNLRGCTSKKRVRYGPKRFFIPPLGD